MKLNFKLERDGNYYFGLALMVIASASIIWAFFFDGFDPKDFLAYFLIYAWGFTLLLKSDSEYRLNRLEETVSALQNRLDRIEADFIPETEAQQGEITEEVKAAIETGEGNEATDRPTGQHEEE